MLCQAIKPIGWYWKLFTIVKKFVSYRCCLLIINLLPIFKKNVNIFNFFFAKQCLLISSSTLLLPKLYMTKKVIQTLCFGKSDVIKLISALDISNAHDHDGISVKMIKI